jgi:predicted acyltransferase
LIAAGYSLILLAILHQVIDVWEWQAWASIFVWIGANAIALYFINGVVGFVPFATRLMGGEVARWISSVTTPGTGAFLLHVLGLVLAVALARFLYRRKIFLRV